MIGSSLGRYQILDRLGEGGMGIVYRALDERLEREVAIKVLRPDALGAQTARQRFRHEARALSRLNHPGIATLFDFDSQNGTDFLVLEFVPGQTLASVLEHGALPEARARTIALGIAEALEAAHELGVVHRDLKPGNVMITPRGRVKVLDFGLARLTGGADPPSWSATTSGDLVGTLPYMAPEQVTNGAVDPRTDLYALGVVLYEMISGERAVSGDSLAAIVFRIVHESPAPLERIKPGHPEQNGRHDDANGRAVAGRQAERDEGDEAQSRRRQGRLAHAFSCSFTNATNSACASSRIRL